MLLFIPRMLSHNLSSSVMGLSFIVINNNEEVVIKQFERLFYNYF
ncbi:hypothetical protein DYY66_1557 [Candidatus Nitrosotalea sp. FS]|nr:hypothetical protein [Candidatus Nitrosotalea sp. FS]